MQEGDMIRPDHGYNDWAIKAFIITMMNDHQSLVSTRKLLWSIRNVGDERSLSDIQPHIIDATLPETIDADIKTYFNRSYARKLYNNIGNLNYTWPTNPSQDGIDFATGLYKRAYGARNYLKVAACTISHMRLWQHCIDLNEPIMILEHDAFFTRMYTHKEIVLCGHKDRKGKYPGSPISDKGSSNEKPMGEWNGGIVAINSPLGTTRKATIYDTKVKLGVNNSFGMVTVPYVDDPSDIPLPSGLPGNSAYIIKPWAAKMLLDKTLEVGIWPNDALMCRQFFPWLQQYYPYFTVVQNTGYSSTTT